MKTLSIAGLVAAVAAAFIGAGPAAAQGDGSWTSAEVSVLGGVQALLENDTAFPDDVLSVPLVGALTYHISDYLAVEGEFTWMIPVEQEIDTGAANLDVKPADMIAYQASLRATLPTGGWAPYLAAGAGGVTFLSNTDGERLPQLDESETAFAVSFGGGLTLDLSPSWGVRTDFRQFVAFPSDDAAGLSDGTEADEIWMSRGAAGLVYRF